MSDASLYYKLSGKSRTYGLLLIAFAGLSCAAAIGFVYGILVMINPFVYFNVIGTGLVGYVVGKVIVKAARLGHVRSSKFVLLTALASGLCLYYFANMGWLMYIIEGSPIIISPIEQLKVLAYISEEGAWSMFGGNVSGIPLIIIWIIEAAILIGGAVFFAFGDLSELIYCETCSLWLDEREALGPFVTIPDPQATKTQLETGDFSVIGDLQPVSEPTNEFATMTLCQCVQCDGLHTMDIHNVTVTTDSDGKAKADATPIVSRMLLDGESYALLQEIVKGHPELEDAQPVEELA